jgi:hypothetical protein
VADRVAHSPDADDGTQAANGIGTLGETSLHAALKSWYARPGDLLEVPVDGFVIDVVRGPLLIEVQTTNFGAIKGKLIALTDRHPVRVVHPIAYEKWIVRMTADGEETLGRRKSPKRGQPVDLFDELVRFPHLVRRPGFSIEVLMTQEEEIRWNDGRGSWRRRGWSIHNRRLLDVVDRILLSSPAEYAELLPPSLPLPFTNRDLARALGVRRRLAQRMTYCLRKMGVVAVVGKRGNALLCAPQPAQSSP